MEGTPAPPLALTPKGLSAMPRNHGFATGGKKTSTAENTASASASVSEDFEVVRLDEQSSVVRIEGAELPFRLDDAGAWVEAEALGAWLGYERPRDARKLALRLKNDGIINDSDICATVAQNHGERGRPAREVWLRRGGALKLAAKSETPRANALLDLIVTVFEAVFDGKSPRTDPSVIAAIGELRSLVCTQSEQLAAYAKRAEEQDQRIRSLQSQVANDVGEVSAEWVKVNVLAPITRIARLEAGSDDVNAVRRARRSVENRVRNVVCFNGRGTAWIHYPRDAQLIRILQRTLATMEQGALDKLSAKAREQAETRAKAEVEARMKQLGLFDGLKNAS